MYNYTAPPSGYEFYRCKTKVSAKHPPYGYSSNYYTPRYTSLDAKQPRRHSCSSSMSSYSHYSTSSPKSYDYCPPPYRSTEKYTLRARLAGLGKLLRVLCLGSFFQVASALPIDTGESMENLGWPGGPGIPSISGWPSPCLGLLFAAAVTHFSKPHSTSRMPGAMALVFNYLSLVASGDAQTPPAVLWTLKGLATYFIVFYGDVTFRKFQMGQGYFALLIFLGLIMDYCVAQILQTGKAEASLLDELFRFSLPTFSLSLCLCAYHAHYKLRTAEGLANARLEECVQIEERLRRENAVPQDGNSQSTQTTQSS